MQMCSEKKYIQTETNRLSERVEQIPEALSIEINQLVYDLKRKGRDIITLSLGEAFFDIPVFDFGSIDFNKGYHYSDSQGIPELRNKIAKYYREHYQAEVDAKKEVLITAGSKIAIYMAMLATVNQRDEVLIHEPAWLSYQEQVKLIGATAHFIPYFADVGDFHQYISPKTRMLILNNPNNPSGRIYKREELEAIYKLCVQNNIYSDFILDGSFFSGGRLDSEKNNVIVVNSLSKNMGMSGWRVGYLISNEKVIKAVLKLNQHLITCAPTVLLYYMEKYFDLIISHTLPQVHDIVLKKQSVKKILKNYKILHLEGGATFYFFLSIENYSGNSTDFAMELLKNHDISVVPGSAYGASTERFIRFSIGTESLERIEHAIKIISIMLKKQIIEN